MKTKSFKKLTLNKKTIADFEIPETRNIYGGTDRLSMCQFPCLPDSMQAYPCPSAECGTVTGDPCIAC
jgi:hypothetical protein